MSKTSERGINGQEWAYQAAVDSRDLAMAERDRLKALNAELLEALKSCVHMLSSPKFEQWKAANRSSGNYWAMVPAMEMREKEARLAIEKAERGDK